MEQCWKEKQEERPSFSSLLQTLENLYELRTPLIPNENFDPTCYVSRTKLKYPSLSFHDESLEKRFKMMRYENLRYDNSL